MVTSVSSKTRYFRVSEILCRGLLAMFLFLLFTTMCSVSAKAQSSSFAGQYSGEWTARFINGYGSRTGKTELTGTWNVSITSSGEVSGTEYNNSSGITETFSGEIGDDGYLKVYLKGKTRSSVIQGRLRQRENTLTGILEQFCDDGIACLATEIRLTRNSLTQRSSNVPNVNTNSANCLPKRGTLIVKMKDGSKKMIDLSEAQAITVVPEP